MRLDAIQISPGAMDVRNETFDMSPATLLRETHNVGVTETLGSEPGTVTFAYLARQYGTARLNSHPWLGRRLAVLFGAAEFTTTEPAIVVRVRVPVGDVPILRETLGAFDAAEDGFVLFATDNAIARKLQRLVDSAFIERAVCFGEGLAVRRRLLALIVRLAGALREDATWFPVRPRDSVAKAAEQYMWAHINDDIGLQEICRGVGCGARTLINYFHDLYGMSPIRFMRILRLNRVRAALRAASGKESTIFDIAADYGFWHMGHFATNYRALFGETPSETVLGAVRA